MEPLSNKIAVIIPTLNEEEAIGAVIRELPRPPVDCVIIADGGSRDNTAQIATEAGALVITPSRPGYGQACWEGAAAAAAHHCDINVFMDGDGADRGDLIERLVRPIIDDHYDFVIASRSRGQRDKGSMNWHQLLAGWLAGLFIGMLYGFRYSDMCAYRAIRHDQLLRLGMQEMTYGWNIEMQIKAAQAGLRILEIPMPYRCRKGGVSKVAGSLKGTLRAGSRIIATFARLAAAGQSPGAR